MTLERRSEHYTYRDIVLVDTQVHITSLPFFLPISGSHTHRLVGGDRYAISTTSPGQKLASLPPPVCYWTSCERFRRISQRSTPNPPSLSTAGVCGAHLMLTTCYVCLYSNGIGRTGVFIALHILLERMVTEGLVDVFQTIKNLRIQRPAMVQTLVRPHTHIETCTHTDTCANTQTHVDTCVHTYKFLHPILGAVPVLLHRGSGLLGDL